MIFVSKSVLLKKEAELVQLRARIKDVTADKEEARQQGDLSENFGYHAASDMLSQLRAQEGVLAAMLSQDFQILDQTTIIADKGRVGLGSQVKYLHTFGRGLPETMNMKISGAWADEDGMIPYNSPLGELLMGKKVGSRFSFRGTDMIEILETIP